MRAKEKHKPIRRLVGAFKTVSTKRVNHLRGTPGVKTWQRNYYEHIIRNDDELNRIREYIANNPAKWETDRETRMLVLGLVLNRDSLALDITGAQSTGMTPTKVTDFGEIVAYCQGSGALMLFGRIESLG